MTSAGRRAAPWLLAGLVLAAMAGTLLHQADHDSLTFDETGYIQSGTCALVNGDISLDPTNPPGFMLLGGAGTLLFGPSFEKDCSPVHSTDFAAFAFAGGPDPDRLRAMSFAARLPAVGTALLFGVLVFAWARALFGTPAALFSLVMLAFEPTFLGHAHLVTGDAQVTYGTVGCLAGHWAWSRTGKGRWLLASGLALGWALLNKVSALDLLPVLFLVGLLMPGTGGLRARAVRARAVRALGATVAIGVTGWLAVCALYLPFHYHTIDSHALPAALAVFAPRGWLHGLTHQLQHARDGHISYLNGQPGMGFWLYFPETMVFKSTLGFLALGGLGLALAARRRDRVVLLYLWLPAAVIFLAATAGRVDAGIRYVLPVYALVAVGAGIVVSRLGAGRAMVIPALLLALAVASSVSHLPYSLGYSNELAGGAPERYISPDSNLDWGQDAWRLRDWWQAQGRPPMHVAYYGTLAPRYYGIGGDDVNPSTDPVNGLLAASLSRTYIRGDTVVAGLAPYTRLQGLKPERRIGTSIDVYRLEGEPILAR